MPFTIQQSERLNAMSWQMRRSTFSTLENLGYNIRKLVMAEEPEGAGSRTWTVRRVERRFRAGLPL